MPVPFQLGLFLTVLVLAGVRFERSLREVFAATRSGRLSRRDRAQPHAAPPAPVELPGAFNWGRWYHLAILWGLALFCVPFLLGVAFPGRIMEASKAADTWLTGGLAPPEIEIDRPLGREESEPTADAAGRLRSRSEEMERARWTAFTGLAAAAAVLLAMGAVAGVARRLGRPGLMTALAGVAFAVSGAAFAFAGPISSRLAGALGARRVIEEYARAPTVRLGAEAPPDQVGVAAWAGPVKVVGRPSASRVAARAEPGYLYFRGPFPRQGADEGDPGRAAPYAGFVLVEPGTGRDGAAKFVVQSAPRDQMRVVLPHVRLGHDGREVFIRDDEDVLVIGYVLSGSISGAPGYPVIVSPADAVLGERGVFGALAADLLGREPVRARCLVLLQLVFGALGAWFVTVSCSGLCEYLVSARDRRRAFAARLSSPKSEPTRLRPRRRAGARPEGNGTRASV